MNIGINIVERKPIVNGSPRIICGNSGDTITFTFDSEWSKYTAKVARFVYVKNGVVEPQEVLFNGNVVEIPVLSNITEVFIGVYAGELRTTTPVTIPCDFSILCKGGEPVDPTPDIYAQILDALNAKLILEGNAQSATRLETPRTIQVDLEKSEGVSFDGTEDVTPGVTGVLPIEKGGTGANTPEGVRDNLSLDTFYAPHAVKRVNGSAITINDSSKSPLASLKLYGKTTQDGTPTPTEPKELKSVGDSGSFMVGVYGKNLLNVPQTIILSSKGYAFEPITIALTKGSYVFSFLCSGAQGQGAQFTVWNENVSIALYDKVVTLQSNTKIEIPFTLEKTETVKVYFYVNAISNTTITNCQLEIGTVATTYEPCNKQTLTMPYTLRSGGDIKDEVDFARGVRTQKMYSITINSMSGVGVTTIGGFTRFGVSATPKAFMYGTGMCNRLNVSKGPIGANNEDNCISGYENGGVYFRCDELANATDRETWLAEHPIHFIYRLATPIETPLTETELNAYRQLMTNSGNTTILSEANSEVDYYTDTLSGESLGNLRSSIYSEIETLKQAVISLGGEV